MVGLAIKPEVSSALAQDAEYRLREIIQVSPFILLYYFKESDEKKRNKITK